MNSGAIAPAVDERVVVPAQGPDRRFATLDGMRGVAAICVMMLHSADPGLRTLVGSGYLAVDFFFMLSGFVLAFAYSPRLERGLGAGEFFALRLARLYPYYVLGLVLGIAYYALFHVLRHDLHLRQTLIPLGFNAFFLPVMVPIPDSKNLLFPFNGVAWSLFWEMVANLILVASFAWLRSSRLIVLIVAGAAAMALCVFFFGSLDAGIDHRTFWGGAARVIFTFFAGVGLYRLWKRGASVPYAHPGFLILLLAATLAIAPGQYRPVYDLGVVLIVYPVLVLAGAGKRHGDPELPGWLNRIFHVVGARSYGLYAIHVPLMVIISTFVSQVFGLKSQAVGTVGAVLYAVAVFIAVGWLDRFWDRPARRLMASVLLPRFRKPYRPQRSEVGS